MGERRAEERRVVFTVIGKTARRLTIQAPSLVLQPLNPRISTAQLKYDLQNPETIPQIIVSRCGKRTFKRMWL
jgi:hypothetical protein